MRVTGTIWLEEVVDKLATKHGVEPEEVEEVLADRAVFRRMERGRVGGEDLYAAAGRTGAGRFLMVFFIHKAHDEALIVTARPMTAREKRRYART